MAPGKISVLQMEIFASLQEQTPILQHTGVKPDIDTPTTDKPKTIGGNK